MSRLPKMKRCPFCAAPESELRIVKGEGFRDMRYIWCSFCEAQGPQSRLKYCGGIPGLIYDWNKRDSTRKAWITPRNYDKQIWLKKWKNRRSKP